MIIHCEVSEMSRIFANGWNVELYRLKNIDSNNVPNNIYAVLPTTNHVITSIE